MIFIQPPTVKKGRLIGDISTIYKATNIITGKHYIGFDSNWPNRLIRHEKNAFNPNIDNYNSKLYLAMRRYGIKAFTWEVIYQSWDKKDCLSVMEYYFIAQYDSFLNGYNMTRGGDGHFDLGKKQQRKTQLRYL